MYKLLLLVVPSINSILLNAHCRDTGVSQNFYLLILFKYILFILILFVGFCLFLGMTEGQLVFWVFLAIVIFVCILLGPAIF